ncbi:hypothetical protein Peur_032957 [Populus x canadensis]
MPACYKYTRNAIRGFLESSSLPLSLHILIAKPKTLKSHQKKKKQSSSQMGNENNDPVVIQSSIALLQERFRQLQRVKAMREEKELSKVLVESPRQLSPSMQYESAASRLFFHPELILQPRSPPHICLPLRPNPQSKQAGFWCELDTPALMSSSPTKALSNHGLLDKFDDSATDDDDIDTSLHL